MPLAYLPKYIHPKMEALPTFNNVTFYRSHWQEIASFSTLKAFFNSWGVMSSFYCSKFKFLNFKFVNSRIWIKEIVLIIPNLFKKRFKVKNFLGKYLKHKSLKNLTNLNEFHWICYNLNYPDSLTKSRAKLLAKHNLKNFFLPKASRQP